MHGNFLLDDAHAHRKSLLKSVQIAGGVRGGRIHMSYFEAIGTPVFGFLVTSPLHFKTRVGSALLALQRGM